MKNTGLRRMQISELSNLTCKTMFPLESRHFLLMEIIEITFLNFLQNKKSKHVFGHIVFLKQLSFTLIHRSIKYTGKDNSYCTYNREFPSSSSFSQSKQATLLYICDVYNIIFNICYVVAYQQVMLFINKKTLKLI